MSSNLDEIPACGFLQLGRFLFLGNSCLWDLSKLLTAFGSVKVLLHPNHLCSRRVHMSEQRLSFCCNRDLITWQSQH